MGNSRRRKSNSVEMNQTWRNLEPPRHGIYIYQAFFLNKIVKTQARKNWKISKLKAKFASKLKDLELLFCKNSLKIDEFSGAIEIKSDVKKEPVLNPLTYDHSDCLIWSTNTFLYIKLEMFSIWLRKNWQKLFKVIKSQKK